VNSKHLKGLAIAAFLFLFVSTSHSQSNGTDWYWRIDPSVKSCSMVINPSLTQAQWHRFAREAGTILSFRSLAPATTLGKKNFEIAIDYSYSPVDQHSLAWINTFVHPDEDCPLGDAIVIPTIRAGMGISKNMDIGGYWTTAPGANYGAVGGELKYAFLQESEKRPAAAVRASFAILTGVPDFNLNIYSVDLMTSKKFGRFAPYVGLRQSLVAATETTSKVDLKDERVSIALGYAGVASYIWVLNLMAEYNVASVNTFAFALGFNL